MGGKGTQCLDAYMCRTESAFDRVYLCGFTTTSAYARKCCPNMKRREDSWKMTSSEGMSKDVKHVKSDRMDSPRRLCSD